MTSKMQTCSLSYVIRAIVSISSFIPTRHVNFKFPSALVHFSPFVQARAIEYMVVDALLAAEPVMRFADYVTNPDRYLHLTDSIIELIQMSDDRVSSVPHFSRPRLTVFQNIIEAQAILNRITSRDLYKTVDYKVFTWGWKGHLRKFFNPEAIVSAAKSHEPENDEERAALTDLKTQHIIIDEAVLHYGMGNNNPIDKVRFYSKRKPQGTLPPSSQMDSVERGL